jgi:hypothetical protein
MKAHQRKVQKRVRKGIPDHLAVAILRSEMKVFAA